MKRVTSLQIDWYDNGLTCGEFVVHQVIAVYRNRRQISYRGYNAISKDPVDAFDVPMDTEQCEDLFRLLEKTENAAEFVQNFSVEVCDGSAWEMRLRHSDNSINMIAGNIVYPTHGEEIEQYILTAIDREAIIADPLVFGCRTYDEDEE